MAKNFLEFGQFGMLIDRKDITKALRKVGAGIKAGTKAAILAGGFGEFYNGHQASLPGDAPANLTGQLAASLVVKVNGTTLTVTDTAKYALPLEAGSEGGGFRKGGGSSKSIRKGRKRIAVTERVIEPRPYLSAELEKQRDDIQETLNKAFENIIKSRTTFK